MAMVSSQSDNAAEQEALSAYLDNQLSDGERVALERRLQTDTQLQATLRELQAVKMVLHDLPTVVPPRSFTLDPATVRRPIRLPLFQLFRLGSALATILLVLTFTLDFVATGSHSAASESAQAPAAPAATTAAAAAGGVAPEAASKQAATSAPASAPFIAPAEQQPTMAVAAQAQAPASDQAYPSALQQEAGSAASEPSTPPEVVQPAQVHASDSSSPGTDSSALPAARQQAGSENAPSNTSLHWLQLVLGVVAAALALGAWAVWRRDRT